MSNPFAGRANPFLIQSSWVWVKIPLISGIAAIAYSMWGCPGFYRGQSELTGWAVLIALTINSLNMGLMPMLIPQFFAEDSWRFNRELLYNSWIVFSGFLLTGLSPVFTGQSFQATDHWYKAVIPAAWCLTVTLTVIYQIICYRKNNRRAHHIQSGIRKRNRLAGDKDREFSLPVSLHGVETSASAYAIIYLQNTGNEATIAFRTQYGVQEGISELDFKTVRESVRKLSNFYRCHRDWMVNMDKVTGIRADALGFLLETEQEGVLIPVSSSLNEDLDGRLMK